MCGTNRAVAVEGAALPTPEPTLSLAPCRLLQRGRSGSGWDPHSLVLRGRPESFFLALRWPDPSPAPGSTCQACTIPSPAPGQPAPPSSAFPKGRALRPAWMLRRLKSAGLMPAAEKGAGMACVPSPLAQSGGRVCASGYLASLWGGSWASGGLSCRAAAPLS